MIANYDIGTDAVIQALIAEAKADPDVIGLVAGNRVNCKPFCLI